ncbi:RNA-binding transcriptional accessory protein [Solitalea sp. MAHUQ-68]|uniref:RNA-binding transcriptional accessory protein n=1 Tax=Solitalea agri TaxID=2953739 RepID=A0A9X2JEG1_9SPHI|nr:Tex family protein [Solitalea agri]MCO4292361.1 RNA-binding transcriptional accessory protein [Solitalea agri]
MSEQKYFLKIAQDLGIGSRQVEATVGLLNEGATIPFISRYRKELTGSLDEVAIAAIRDEIERLRELDKRRETILNSIKEQGKLTDELEKDILAAATMSRLEDLYLPYKPKRRTKATIARERGLEPLALAIFSQEVKDIEGEAAKFIDVEKEVNNESEALQGARDIIAEMINEDAVCRDKMRTLFTDKAMITSTVMKGKEEEGAKYRDYFEWSELLKNTPSHRLLAMRRGEKEMILSLDIAPVKEDAIDIIEGVFVKSRGEAADQIKIAIDDCYKRLLAPSIETEMRLLTKKGADEKAIVVFADNLRELLLAAPMGQKCILAIDPGFRTGCKVVVLNPQGKLLENTVIYPTASSQGKMIEAEAVVLALCQRFPIEAIAIGNGTASRETETFVRGIKDLPKDIAVVMVNEAGASVYSASEVAREEFPDYDVTVRGAVSIGRRLADPLAELVKIDPKSIGVGQYQHDVDQTALKNKLDEVVGSCVNAVGVEVNTASKQLLTYVSGLGPALAQNIINYRNENGAFKSRKDLMAVPRMGEKVFEQAAGFLRIVNGVNPLDSSAVHPESYHIVEQMTKDLNCKMEDLLANKELRKKIDLKKYVSETVGLPTLNDIMQELDKPGRDPRKEFEAFKFADDVNEIADLKIGMRLPGIVTNVTNFGAFVDIGVHQDGLVHLSQLSNKFITDANEVVKVAQQVWVTVTEVDVDRKRIALTMKDESAPAQRTKVEKEKMRNDRANRPSQQQQSKPKAEEPQDMNSMLAALKNKWK